MIDDLQVDFIPFINMVAGKRVDRVANHSPAAKVKVPRAEVGAFHARITENAFEAGFESQVNVVVNA